MAVFSIINVIEYDVIFHAEINSECALRLEFFHIFDTRIYSVFLPKMIFIVQQSLNRRKERNKNTRLFLFPFFPLLKQ